MEKLKQLIAAARAEAQAQLKPIEAEHGQPGHNLRKIDNTLDAIERWLKEIEEAAKKKIEDEKAAIEQKRKDIAEHEAKAKTAPTATAPAVTPATK